MYTVLLNNKTQKLNIYRNNKGPSPDPRGTLVGREWDAEKCSYVFTL